VVKKSGDVVVFSDFLYRREVEEDKKNTMPDIT
jgi:hypothetical protein